MANGGAVGYASGMSDTDTSAALPIKELPRSNELMNAHDTGLLVVDVQAKLVPAILEHRRLVWNVRRLLDAAKLLALTVAATEQYPRGLGRMVAPLGEYFSVVPEKSRFSCGECGEIFAPWDAAGVHRVLLCGIETHVCVQQTALDLLAAGFRVYLAVDATGARYRLDHDVALRRMESSGVVLTTTEAAMFEWCGRADRGEFKAISALAKQSCPED